MLGNRDEDGKNKKVKGCWRESLREQKKKKGSIGRRKKKQQEQKKKFNKKEGSFKFGIN